MAERARRYSWPAFEPGNQARLTHGARSPAVIAPLATELLESLATIAPWARAPHFVAAREAWAWAEAQCVLLRRYLDEHGLIDGEDVRSAATYLEKVERRATTLRASLGLDPQSAAKLLGQYSVLTATVDGVADEVEALKELGRQMLDAAEGRVIDAVDETDDEDEEPQS